MKKFILDTLLPYKNDRNLCGYDNKEGLCKYIDDNGNSCAVGKHMRNVEDYRYSTSVLEDLVANDDCEIEDENLLNIITDEAYNNISSYDIWAKIQSYHDSIAMSMAKIAINGIVKDLEYLTGLDLTELKY